MMAKDTVIGKVYASRGGTFKDVGGQVRSWGYDRIRVKSISDKKVVVETAWGTEVNIPIDYILYSTPEEELKGTPPAIKGRDSGETVELTFEEAISKGYEKVNVKINPEDIERKVTNELLIGGRYTIIGLKFGLTTQQVRHIAIKMEKTGKYVLNKAEEGFKLICI